MVKTGRVQIVVDETLDGGEPMNARRLIVDMAMTFPLTFVVAGATTFGYSLIAHGNGVVDWETAIQLAIIFGVVLPLARMTSPDEGEDK
jgi:hypothetical protein